MYIKADARASRYNATYPYLTHLNHSYRSTGYEPHASYHCSFSLVELLNHRSSISYETSNPSKNRVRDAFQTGNQILIPATKAQTPVMPSLLSHQRLLCPSFELLPNFPWLICGWPPHIQIQRSKSRARPDTVGAKINLLHKTMQLPN